MSPEITNYGAHALRFSAFMFACGFITLAVLNFGLGRFGRCVAWLLAFAACVLVCMNIGG